MYCCEASPLRSYKDGAWVRVCDVPPPHDIPVMTKIHNGDGCRNEQVLIRRGNLYYTSGQRNAMYTYYKPTHWFNGRPEDAPVSKS